MEKKKIVLLTTEPESFVQEKLAAAAEKADSGRCGRYLEAGQED